MTNLVFNSGCELSRYINEISKFPTLSLEEEIDLTSKIDKYGDRSAAKKIILSHLRLVVRIAMNYRNYGLAILDLISEGNIGLMYAVSKFKLNMGCRIATYATWWIKSHIQSFILKSWSLVKIANNRLREKLFCKQKQVQNLINNYEDITNVNFLAQDQNNAKIIYLDKSDEDTNNSINYESIADNKLNIDEELINSEEKIRKKAIVNIAISKLDLREKEIIIFRRIKNKIQTLGELALKYGVSSERIRQIEERALSKMKKVVNDLNTLPTYALISEFKKLSNIFSCDV
ncbi:sigma-70 family RNA polymerase sigma factor [Lyticum sinuosum]|uniref:RNA polymerase sigma factor n=1 Tax=Lyticum sinuosum TaxID=1332059 RepID=A0AAE5AHY5_9RICK|nr:sigma-70 family RNA polymerase sigma factor [Lyticum sinuosum]MDZ5761551.1 RNA polymerase sigma factor RpoH [Lyticum sinuosum]